MIYRKKQNLGNYVIFVYSSPLPPNAPSPTSARASPCPRSHPYARRSGGTRPARRDAWLHPTPQSSSTTDNRDAGRQIPPPGATIPARSPARGG